MSDEQRLPSRLEAEQIARVLEQRGYPGDGVLALRAEVERLREQLVLLMPVCQARVPLDDRRRGSQCQLKLEHRGFHRFWARGEDLSWSRQPKRLRSASELNP